jgi:hypothetical protein
MLVVDMVIGERLMPPEAGWYFTLVVLAVIGLALLRRIDGVFASVAIQQGDTLTNYSSGCKLTVEKPKSDAN